MGDVGVRNVFLRGRPGIGKTTALRRAVALIPDDAHGFTTREAREGRRRVGFMIEDLQGESAVMAHVDFPGPVRVSRYGVDVDAVERIGVAALRRAVASGTLAIVDEVGKMELACPAFVDALMEALDAPVPVLGTIHAREDSVTRSIGAREDTRILQLTGENRDEMPARLAATVADLGGG